MPAGQALSPSVPSNDTAIPSDSRDYIDNTFEADRNIAYVGEDRGARITITNSTFKHMHFCKGMIVYKETRPITYDEYKLFVNYTASGKRELNITDGRAEPFIKIMDNVFENIGYQ